VSQPRLARSQVLDILRAVAILLVFSRHTGLPPFSMAGWAGVDLFFVLSGFLVSGLLFREYRESGRVRSARFLLRRGFKIYPQFYLLILLTLVLSPLTGLRGRGAKFAAEVFFVQNYFPGLWGHTWSLAVEEHFYLLLAAVIGLLSRRGGEDPFQPLARWIPVVFGAVLLFRIATYAHDPLWSYYRNLYPSHLRIDSLLAGVLLSYYHVYRGPSLAAFVSRHRAWLARVSLLLLAPAAVLDQSRAFIYTFGFTMLWAGFALLLLIALYPQRRSVRRPGRGGRTLAALGRVSYAFYLWHIPVIQLTDWAQSRYRAASLAMVLASPILAFFVTLAIAFLTTWALEAPLLRLRDRLVPSGLRAPLVVAGPATGA